MAHQMIYTSIKSGLVAGRSGFCTAARHKEIREALVSRIEDLSSQFDRSPSATGLGSELPVIYAHRIVAVREKSYHVLMRIADAGNDYSGRTNHIAHSIVLEPDEVTRLRITPAEAILQLIRNGVWRDRYEEAARYFGPEDEIQLSSFEPTASLPAGEWAAQSGASATAALLVEPKAAGGVGLVPSEGYDPDLLLKLFAESALIESPDRSSPVKLWSRSFTTLLQSTSQRNDFNWHGCVFNSQVHMQELKSNRYLVELSHGMTVPSGPLAEIAEGRQVTSASGKAADDPIPEVVAPEAEITPATVAPADSPPAGTPQSKEPETTPASVPAALSGTAAIPSDLLAGTSPASPQKKSGVSGLLVGGIGAAALIAIGIGALVFLNPVRKAERRISAALEEGNWQAASEQLNAIEKNEQKRFIDKSAEFSDMKSLIEGYEKLTADYNNAAYQTEKFLRSSEFRKEDPLRVIEERKRQWELALKRSPLELESPARLGDLEKEANQTVQGYFEQRKKVGNTWTRLMDLKLPETGIEKIREDIFALNTDSDILLAQLKDIGEVIPFVEEFLEEQARTHPDNSSKEAAEKRLAQLSEQLSTIQSKAAGRSWEKYLSAVRTKIATFEPRVKAVKAAVSVDPGSSRKKMPEAGKKSPEPPPEKALIPPTYLVPILADSNRLSFSGIKEMEAGVPDTLAIRPAESHSDEPMLFKKELAEIGGETVMYYFTGADTVKIFSVDQKEKAIMTTDDFRPVFGNGFALGFGTAGSSSPDFQLFGQVPTNPSEEILQHELPWFFHLPISEGVTQKEGGNFAITLSDKATGILSRLSYVGTLEGYEFILGRGDSRVKATSLNPTELSLSLSKEMDAQIEKNEASLAAYASLRDVATKFENAFGNLGEKLFQLKDGKAKTTGLLVKSVPQKNKPPVFALDDDPEKSEELTGLISPSLKDYISRSGDFIEGPPLFHYIAVHLYEALWDNGIADSRRAGPDVKNALRDAFEKIGKTETWGEEEIREAIRLLGLVSDTSREFKLALPPELKERYPNQKEAEGARKRREKFYRKDLVLASFFKNWEEIVTKENLTVAETMVLNGGSFDEAILQRMQTSLDALKQQRASLAETPLSEIGTFSVEALVKSEDGTNVVFRVLKMSPFGKETGE